MNSISKILELRPEVVKNRVGSKICLLNSHDIFSVLKDKDVIIMACNIRIKHVIPGLMRASKDLDAVIAFELAKSEGDTNGGYTGQTPKIFFDTVVEYAEDLKFDKPFFIHGDHITVKNTDEKDIEEARKLINDELSAGYTSFAIDASFNPIPDNIRITSDLAKPIINARLGLEVEVGEIKQAGSEGKITTVEEAKEFINGLIEREIHPILLAINNGSKHGNYLEGEKVHIDLDRTGEIYNEIKKYGISIAQHGITGTPLNIIGRFADYGIRKGNVGTQWQNIAHKGLPAELFQTMKKWANENKKDIKFATKVFKSEIDDIPEKNKRNIEKMAYEEAIQLIKAFRAEGTASMVIEGLISG